MKLSFIIVNFNTPQLTIDCLRSVRTYFGDDPHTEVILIDNAPKQNHENDFRKEISRLIYLQSKNNIGFGKANNMGMEIARGEYYLLLNSDTLLPDNSILESIAFMDLEENKKVGLLGCRLLNKDLSIQGSFYPFTGNSIRNYFKANNPVLYKIFRIQKKFSPPDEPTEVGDVSGAFMLLRKSVFESTRGFDPDFFLYCEETEWCRNRISKHYRIIHFPGTRIIHLGGQSAPQGLMYKQAQVSQALFWYKSGLDKYVLFILFSLLNCFYYFVTFPLMKKEGKEAAKKYGESILTSIPYWFYRIPRFKRSFGARSEGLIYEPARYFFFEQQNNL